MAIEDLPVIKFEDINNNTLVAERAEITWRPCPEYAFDIAETVLAYMLGKGLYYDRNVLFAWTGSRSSNPVSSMPIIDARDKLNIRVISVEHIIKYDSLLPKK
jgi:hypothetical protein